jgi:hypothetical protein
MGATASKTSPAVREEIGEAVERLSLPTFDSEVSLGPRGRPSCPGAPPPGSKGMRDGYPGVETPGYSRSSPSANPEAADLPLILGGIRCPLGDSPPTKWVHVNSRGFQPTVERERIHDPDGVAPSAAPSDPMNESTSVTLNTYRACAGFRINPGGMLPRPRLRELVGNDKHSTASRTFRTLGEEIGDAVERVPTLQWRLGLQRLDILLNRRAENVKPCLIGR